MSVVFSGSFSGQFIGTGNSVFIPLPSGVDWMWVKNQTVSYAAGAGNGAEFYWQYGMTSGQGTLYTKEATIGALVPSQIAAGAGFFLQNNTINVPTSSRVISAITNAATPPVVTTADITGLISDTSIVRIYRTLGALQLQAIDFTVGTVTPTGGTAGTFGLKFMRSIATAGTTGSYAIIPFDPYFYPTFRYITKIGTDPIDPTQTIVTLSVIHQYQVGQDVRFKIPTVTATTFGSVQLNNVEGYITAIGNADVDGFTNTITVNISPTSFSAFAWPLTTDPAFTPATVEPVGESTATALNAVPQANLLTDATYNTAQFGMLLQAGVSSPAGSASDVINWVAGKSFNGV